MKKISLFPWIFLLLSIHAFSAPLLHNGSRIGWLDQGGNAWLRLDLSDAAGQSVIAGRTYAELQAGFDYAGRGWRLADREEIRALWQEFFPVFPDTTLSITQRGVPGTEALALMDAFGVTFTSVSHDEFALAGYSADTLTDASGNLLSIYTPTLSLFFLGQVGGSNVFDAIWSLREPGYPNQFRSAWMIAADSAVAAPGLFWLLLSGLPFLAPLAKREGGA